LVKGRPSIAIEESKLSEILKDEKSREVNAGLAHIARTMSSSIILMQSKLKTIASWRNLQLLNKQITNRLFI
jgi:hypothetical protein